MSESFYKIEEGVVYTYISHRIEDVHSTKSGNDFQQAVIECSDGISTVPRYIGGKFIIKSLETPDFIRKGEKFVVERVPFKGEFGEDKFFRRITNKTRGIKLSS